ncbi:MAG: hypothetical protein JKY66_05725 [Spongiibacteraceae bacterium]|nr:hypothetical protein [Spongiibacteraceae bacterium]
MLRIVCFTVWVLSVFLATSVLADSVSKVRQRLIENQRNIIYLGKEKQRYQKELEAIVRVEGKAALSDEQALTVRELEEDIALGEILIANISLLVSQQRLALATLERGSPPRALDIALNKALGVNLSDLAKTLSSNQSAKKEVSRLRTLLKQQAYVGSPTSPTKTSVSLANEQHVAEAEFLKLLSLFSAGKTDISEDKAIKITWIADRTPYMAEEMLSYLGHGQYHMETMVHSGKMTFTVDGRPWQLSVSEEEDSANYVIIYDHSIETEPRFVMFNKSLLLE